MKLVEFIEEGAERATLLICPHSIEVIRSVSNGFCWLYMSGGHTFFVKGTLSEVTTRLNK